MLNQIFWISLALKSLALLSAAWGLAFLFRRGSAAARHLIWTAAFAALLALPVFSAWLPLLRVRMASPQMAAVFQTLGSTAADIAAARALLPAMPAEPPSHSGPRPWLVLLWAGGSGIFLAQMLLSWIRMARIRRAAGPFDALDPAPFLHALGIRRHIDLLRTERGRMPMACGLFRPAVLLPEDAAEWSAERCRVVLLHELAHLHRGDPSLHVMARIAVSFYWWNPLAWIAWREFLKERERAADDLVLRAGARAADYAGHLLEIARALQLPNALASAALAMARRSQLEGRLLAILDSRVNRSAPRRAAAVFTVALAIAAVAPFAALQAQDRTVTLPADVEATIRTATAQQNPAMLDSAANAAEIVQQYDLARRLLDASLAVRAARSGPQSVSYGLGLIQLGDLERGRNQLAGSDAFYTRAVSVLGNRPEAAPALVHLAISVWEWTKDPAAALDYLQRAQAADPAHAGPALTWMALIEADPGRQEELFKQALSLEQPGAAEAALTMELYASFLRRQNREDEAKSIGEQAVHVRTALGEEATTVRRGPVVTAVRAGGGVSAPVLLSKVEPQYTEEAQLAKYQGMLAVSAVIGTDGSAQSMRVIRGLGLGLDEQALKAIAQWKFQPGVWNGQPVPVQATIEVNFRLL